MALDCPKCGGTGYVDDVPCVCKVTEAFKVNLAKFIPYGKPSEGVIRIVDTFLLKHKQEKPGRPIHWYYVEDKKGSAKDNLQIVMQMWMYFLIQTDTYFTHKLAPLNDITGWYYSYGDVDTEVWEADFYGHKCKTFLILCENKLLPATAADVLGHFLDFYKDRNIFVYLTKEFRDKPVVWKTVDDKRVKIQLETEAYATTFKNLPTFVEVTLLQNK